MLELMRNDPDLILYRYKHYTAKSLMITLPLTLISIICVVLAALDSRYFTNQPLVIKGLFSLFITLLSYYLIGYFTSFFKYETVLLVRNVGIQISTSSLLFPESVRISSRLVPFSIIKDLIITECFRGLRIIFCLSILLDDYRSTERKLITIFPDSDLKLQEYKMIRKNLRKFLLTS